MLAIDVVDFMDIGERLVIMNSDGTTLYRGVAFVLNGEKEVNGFVDDENTMTRLFDLTVSKVTREGDTFTVVVE